MAVSLHISLAWSGSHKSRMLLNNNNAMAAANLASPTNIKYT